MTNSVLYIIIILYITYHDYIMMLWNSYDF